MEDTSGGLFFEMAPKLDLAGYVINIVELGGEAMKLSKLIEHAVITGLILYRNIDFHPYSPYSPLPKTKFFNLFLGFNTKPASMINLVIMDPCEKHNLRWEQTS